MVSLVAIDEYGLCFSLANSYQAKSKDLDLRVDRPNSQFADNPWWVRMGVSHYILESQVQIVTSTYLIFMDSYHPESHQSIFMSDRGMEDPRNLFLLSLLTEGVDCW